MFHNTTSKQNNEADTRIFHRIVYFLPIWFQAIKEVSAVDSGIRLLPLTLAMVVASMSTGILTSKIGYYTPFLITGVCVMSVGAGLLTTLEVGTGSGKWIGYQILYGFGMGLSFQAPNLAAQTVLPTRDVPIGTSLMFFSQLLGGAIFISVGENVLNTQLVQRLSSLPDFNVGLVIDNGATALTSSVPANLLPQVLLSYNEALRKCFQIGLIMCCLTILGAAAMEWRSVKQKKPSTTTTAAAADAEKGEKIQGPEDEEIARVASRGITNQTAAAAAQLPAKTIE